MVHPASRRARTSARTAGNGPTVPFVVAGVHGAIDPAAGIPGRPGTSGPPVEAAAPARREAERRTTA
ncbi:hypothetical protein ACFXGA_32565 [Actinosynnema sp. NPDC059335]|uniref:hypothetical protein n=1 Tax=Actinosynnema sp. NPDC059335 TaxID=3346804 RepID=UPI00366D2001